MTKRYVEAAEAAKMIRRDLKAAFPTTKFSVRSSTYSMGASVDVRWTDGPSTRGVRALVDRYNAKDFDGMQDLWIHRPDQIVDGEVVTFLATVDVHREISNAARLNATMFAERYGGVEIEPNGWSDLFACWGSDVAYRVAEPVDLTDGWPADEQIRASRDAAV